MAYLSSFSARSFDFLLFGITWGVALLSTHAAAEESTADQSVPLMKEVIVTGTRIKGMDAETVGPLQVITREELRRSGATSVAEALRHLPSNSPSGALNQLTGSNSFSPGASSISLRGMGSSGTLVLINGRRVAPYGLSDPNFGQSNVVNVEALPIDVIDRIEILKDGASAIYGSDAIAGVVNIVLRKDYKGTQVSGAYAINNESEYKNWNGGITIGWGDLKEDRYNIFANWEHADQTRTTLSQTESFLNRDEYRNGRFQKIGVSRSSYSVSGNYYNAVYDPTTLGGATYVSFLQAAPGCAPQDVFPNGVCRFNYWPYVEVIPKSQRDSFFTRGQLGLGAGVNAFMELSYTRSQTQYRSTPPIFGDLGSWYAPNIGQIVNVPEVLPVGNPANPFSDHVGYRHVFTEIGPSGKNIDSRAIRWLTGLNGSYGIWDWETAALYTSTRTDDTAVNALSRSALMNAVLNGTYDFLNPSAGTVKPSDLAVNSKNTGRASFQGIDAKVSSELMQLPAGGLGFAAGAEYRRETLDARPDSRKGDGEIVGFGAAAASGSRNVASLFAELSIPIFKNLDSQLALRTDKYSDYGRSTTPKAGLKWELLPGLALRGTYSEGFRAPALSQISQSNVSGFGVATDPQRCIVGDESDCFREVGLLIEANPNVKPEESKSFTGGFVIKSASTFSMSVDYFDIRRTNEISYLSFGDILANEFSSDPRYAGRVVRGPADQPGVPGPIQTLRTGFYNLSRTKVTGIDIDIRGKLELGSWGRLKAEAGGSYYISNKQAADDASPMVDYIGTRGFPRVFGNANVTWEYSNFATWLTVNYVGRQSAITSPGNSCADEFDLNVEGVCELKAWTTLDFGVEYKGFKNLTAGLLIRNIQNKQPVIDPTSTVIPGSLTWNNPYGRYFVLSMSYKF